MICLKTWFKVGDPSKQLWAECALTLALKLFKLVEYDMDNKFSATPGFTQLLRPAGFCFVDEITFLDMSGACLVIGCMFSISCIVFAKVAMI